MTLPPTRVQRLAHGRHEIRVAIQGAAQQAQRSQHRSFLGGA